MIDLIYLNKLIVIFRNYPGNFNCECTENEDSYNNCSTSKVSDIPPKNYYFLFNPLILINEPHEFLLIIESLGNKRCTLEIKVKDFVMINEQITFTNQKIFEKIAFDDLMKLIKKMNLKNVPEFNKIDHYHMVFKKTLNSFSQPITVLFQNSQASAAYYKRNVNAKVYSKIGHCIPKVYSEDCNIPSNPKPVLYHHSNSFNPIVERNCSESSKLTYQWSVNHVLDTSKFN